MSGCEEIGALAGKQRSSRMLGSFSRSYELDFGRFDLEAVDVVLVAGWVQQDGALCAQIGVDQQASCQEDSGIVAIEGMSSLW